MFDYKMTYEKLIYYKIRKNIYFENFYVIVRNNIRIKIFDKNLYIIYKNINSNY